ncbi:stage II sporulation protein R [Desulfitobacterium sp. THU1]|uniref:stage II sporulation protein R n=1 Tax=Desulfitobacterium sp. THU1 TaxID=3138072 RepID=UPI00311EEDCB
MKSAQGADYSKIAGTILVLILTVLFQIEVFHSSFAYARSVEQAKDMIELTQAAENWRELIRFHVVANSDSNEDQALKRAVRDAILKEVSPKLARSKTLAESRQILTGLRPEMEEISRDVIKAWQKGYEVKTEYGDFIFPTKSYGSLILPAGEYEAVRVVIGEGKGSNWWCVLFPPLCFVDIEHSTAQPVDGKIGIPYDESNTLSDTIAVSEQAKPEVRFWVVEKLRDIKDKK